ncbi:MAG: HAD-IIB family hydrolase [Calditrichia bacterium]|nr:HAD-IIB family hydrolase [Calditrichia bacterium]
MNIQEHNILIFTDMDGTLLEHNNYSFAPALNGLKWIKSKNIPLVLVSSKTSDEIIFWQKELGINTPFVVENGSAIFFPNNYFKKSGDFYHHSEHNLKYLKLGEHFKYLKTEFSLLSSQFPIKGFYQMTEDEIVNQTGLNFAQAMMASKREFSIPFVVKDNNKEKIIESLKVYLKNKNIEITEGGRFYHFLGKTNKGRAIIKLISLFKEHFLLDNIISFALGDAPNDIKMLQAVKHPVLVEKHNGGYWDIGQIPNLIKAKGKGPYGWQWAIDNVIKKTYNNLREKGNLQIEGLRD